MSDPERRPLIANERGEHSGGWSAHREKVANVIESKRLHQFVIALIAIDAACVLAELVYTFLSESCIPPDEDGPPWLEVLSQISLAITTFFLVEIPITLYAFGPKYCNPFGGHPHASLHLFDWTVILVTFTLEFVLKGKERELVGLLVVLRLWRLVKLVGGIAVGAGELEEETLRELLTTKRELEEAKATIAALRAENERLTARPH